MLRISETGREYVDEGEDSLLDRLLSTLNEIPEGTVEDFEFCPTGPHGGIDPTCSPKNKVIEESQANNKEVLSDIDTWGNSFARLLARDAVSIGGSYNPGERLFIYRSAKTGTVQGIMLYAAPPSSTVARIYYLASNERGAGTHLMRHAFERAVSENRDLSLSSTDSAVNFYKKMGMSLDKGGGGIFKISPTEMKERLAA